MLFTWNYPRKIFDLTKIPKLWILKKRVFLPLQRSEISFLSQHIDSTSSKKKKNASHLYSNSALTDLILSSCPSLHYYSRTLPYFPSRIRGTKLHENRTCHLLYFSHKNKHFTEINLLIFRSNLNSTAITFTYISFLFNSPEQISKPIFDFYFLENEV